MSPPEGNPHRTAPLSVSQRSRQNCAMPSAGSSRRRQAGERGRPRRRGRRGPAPTGAFNVRDLDC